jgi:endonuclease YncB( thermonuclease family)
LVVVGATPAHAAPARLLTATVLRVADGDTLTAETGNGTKLRIRLLGIDAPEVSHNGKPGQPYGRAATDYLEKLVDRKTVRVEAYGRDQHNRVLAVLWVDSRNVNVEMVRVGLAELYRGTRCQVYCSELQHAEREAQQGRVGMWSQARPESPREFRHRMRIRGGWDVSCIGINCTRSSVAPSLSISATMGSRMPLDCCSDVN